MPSKYPWKLLLVMNFGSMEIMKDTTEASTIWQYKIFLIDISMEINGAVDQKYQKRFTIVEYTVPWTTSHLTLHGMVKILASMSSENLAVIYNP